MQAAWSSYEEVAQVYGSVAERLYCAAPARDLAGLLDLREHRRVLDIGTGSGAVAAAMHASRAGLSLFGCDPALAMVRLVRSRLPGGRFAVASLPRMPFRRQAFDTVTLGFVLSHVDDVVQALREVRRLLKGGGEVGLSSWSESPGSSAPGDAWDGVAHGFIAPEKLQNAMSQALPHEEQVSSPAGLAHLLRQAGFERWQIEERRYRIDVKTDDYIASRLISIASRYMFLELAPGDWDRFVKEARDTLKKEFGERLSFETSVNLAVASSPKDLIASGDGHSRVT